MREIRTLGSAGGTSTSGHAGSVRALTRKRQLPRGSAKATVARLVPTYHSIPHDLIEKAVAHHTDLAWLRLYVGRWLRAPIERADGTLLERTKGTPQGGVASPLLANLFLHYGFDAWMQRTFPNNPFEKFADDAIVHCRSESEARLVLEAIRVRFAECGLELHPTKTKIVYCKDDDRLGNTSTTRSTSSAMPSNHDERRTGGESSS